MRGTPGAYVLLVSLAEAGNIRVGKRHAQRFAPGLYLYVGSALGGLESRVARHLCRQKRLHWHIDYLLEVALVRQVFILPTRQRVECPIACHLATRFEAVPGFGCSDCQCRSHLFFAGNR